jgi:Uncharacterised nucleotidyltransferase
MNGERDILVACSRLSFGDAHRSTVLSACGRGPVNWDLLLASARAHKIAPLAYRNLRACDCVASLIPDHVHAAFSSDTLENLRLCRLLSSRLGKLIRHFESRSHNVMLIKRSAVALALDRSYELTAADDADMIIYPNDPQTGIAETWQAINEFNEDTDAPLFDVDCRTHHDITMNDVISVDFDDVWRDAETVRIDGFTARRPCVEDLIIFAAINVVRKRFVRLRSLLDMSELLNTYQDVDWAEVERKSASYQCDRIVGAGVCAARTVLGGACPELSGSGPIRMWAIRHVVDRISEQMLSSSTPWERPPGMTMLRRAREPRSPWAFGLRLLCFSERQYLRYARLALSRMVRGSQVFI